MLCAVANIQEGPDSTKIGRLRRPAANDVCLLKNLDTPRIAVDILSSDSVKNQLLAALPHAESQRWLPLAVGRAIRGSLLRLRVHLGTAKPFLTLALGQAHMNRGLEWWSPLNRP
jgi:hypothetical protein